MTLARWTARRLAMGLASAATAVMATACAALPPSPPTPAVSGPGSGGAAAAAAAVSARVPTSATSAHTATPAHAAASAPAKAPAVVASRGAISAAGTPSVAPPVAQPAGNKRLVTFVNKTSQTIWVAASPDPSQPIARTGWVVRPGQSVTTTMANHYSGRIWGRTGCVFNAAGNGHCQTGDCGGKFQCTGWGTIPATLFEIDADAWQRLDFYDVSMVDGSNGPMYINTYHTTTRDPITSNGCIYRSVDSGCTSAVQCPSAIQVRAAGKVVGCISPCARFNTDQYCCRGPWAPRANCQPAKWPVDYAAYFKKAEPYAYSYVDDDATSVFTCLGSCDYKVIFGVTPK